MNKQHLIFSFFICLVMQSCYYQQNDDSNIDLGSGYQYIQESPESITKQITVDGKTINLTIISPKVVKYSFNDDYIIAKSVNYAGQNPRYWIIDKKKESTSPEPLDSINFMIQIKIQNINLTFDK